MTAPGSVFIPGVEEPLPAGERVLWQGRPSARAVARHVFHVRALAVYFALLICLRAVSADGAGPLTARAAALVPYLAGAGVALLLFALVSLWVARSTVYAITDRRVVLKIGMAMPMTLNVPLRCVASAGIRQWRDGTGEIVLTLSGTDRFAYFLLWPHARPWHFTRPQPALRGLGAPHEAGAVLAAAAAAVATEDESRAAPPVVAPADATLPVPGRMAPPARMAG
jgi:hypothetical protein